MVRLLSAAALIALAAPSASLAAKKPVKCTGNKVVRKNAQVKIVRQKVHSYGGGTEVVGSRFVGCAIGATKGHVLSTSTVIYLRDHGRRVGVFGGETTTYATLHGKYVYERYQYQSNDADQANGTVVNVATGKGYGVYSYSSDDDSSVYPPSVARLDDLGIFVGLYPDGLKAYNAQGTSTVLDTGQGIDAKSIVLDGATVTWTNDGQQKTATVS